MSADPHREYDKLITFYRVFEGDEAERVMEVIEEYVERFPETPEEGICLYRVSDTEQFMYSYGEICVEELGKLPSLPNDMDKKDVFALPLRPLCAYISMHVPTVATGRFPIVVCMKSVMNVVGRMMVVILANTTLVGPMVLLTRLTEQDI